MNVKVLNILRSLFFNVRKKRGLAIFEFLGGEGGGGGGGGGFFWGGGGV